MRVPWNDSVYLKRRSTWSHDSSVVRNRRRQKEQFLFVFTLQRGFEDLARVGQLATTAGYLNTLKRPMRKFLIILQIEHFETIENLEEILKVERLSAIFIGPGIYLVL